MLATSRRRLPQKLHGASGFVSTAKRVHRFESSSPSASTSKARAMQRSQMNIPGPAISLRT